MTHRSSTIALIVEPSRMLGKAVADACARRGVDTRRCETVGQGIELVTAQRPITVFTSQELPGLPGTSLIAALRACPFHRAIPVAVMTTAPTASTDESTAPDAVILKDRTLGTQVQAFLDRLHIGEPPASTAKAAPTPLMAGEILLAEDSAPIQRLFGAYLHVAGANVMIVSNGAEAVEAAVSRPFDLILMDVEMPVLDGRQAVAELRARGVTTPIIASTAHERAAFLDEARACGFDDVLSKTAGREQFIAFCRGILTASLRESAA